MARFQAISVPSCAASSFSASRAKAFDPTSISYYKYLWSAWLPGLVLGTLAIAGGCAFLGWLCSLCCRRHSWKFALEQLPTGPNDPYNPNNGEYYRCALPSGGEGPPPWLRWSPMATSSRANWGAITTGRRKPKRTRHGLVQYGLFFSFLLVAAMSAWGLVSAIMASNGRVTQAWEYLDEAEAKVTLMLSSATSLLDDVQAINSTLSLLSGQEPANATALSGQQNAAQVSRAAPSARHA